MFLICTIVTLRPKESASEIVLKRGVADLGRPCNGSADIKSIKKHFSGVFQNAISDMMQPTVSNGRAQGMNRTENVVI